MGPRRTSHRTREGSQQSRAPYNRNPRNTTGRKRNKAELAEMLRNMDPSRFLDRLLHQELRGITAADIFGIHDESRHQLMEIFDLIEQEKPQPQSRFQGPTPFETVFEGDHGSGTRTTPRATTADVGTRTVRLSVQSQNGTRDSREVLLWDIDRSQSAENIKKIEDRYGVVRIRGACPHVNVEMGEYTTKALLDSGSEINVISKEFANVLGLPINRFGRDQRHFAMVTASGEVEGFVGYIRDAPIRVGSITIVTNLMVANRLSQACLLGIPFHIVAQVQTTYNLNGTIDITCVSADGSREVSLRSGQDSFLDQSMYLADAKGIPAHKRQPGN